MRREQLYLDDICAAAEAIAGFIAGLNEERFSESDLVSSAVIQKLAVIGEAASRVSEELRLRHPKVPWGEIRAFRNILVHAYFGVDWKVLWWAASKEVPVLLNQIRTILQNESDGTESG